MPLKVTEGRGVSTQVADRKALFLKSPSSLVLSVRYAFDMWRQTTPLRNHKYRRVCLVSWWLQIVLPAPRLRYLQCRTNVFVSRVIEIFFLTFVHYNLWVITLSSFCLRSLSAAVNTYYLACSCCPINSSYVLLSNKIALLMDILLHQLTVSLCTERRRRCWIYLEVFVVFCDHMKIFHVFFEINHWHRVIWPMKNPWPFFRHQFLLQC